MAKKRERKMNGGSDMEADREGRYTDGGRWRVKRVRLRSGGE